MKRKKLFILLFVLIVIVGISIGVYQKIALERNHNVTIGYIDDVETTSKSPDVFVKFTYEVSNQKLISKSSIPCPKADCYRYLYSLLKGKKLAVVYERSNFDNCLMLFRKMQYEKYKINLTPEEEKIVFSIDSLIQNK